MANNGHAKPALAPRSHLWLSALTLCQRELVRFYRQRSRIIGVIGSPLVFWFLIGSGLGSSFRHPSAGSQMNYLEFFYPGTMVLVILFTSIFSTISVIEDRQAGFLQSVVVAPVSRTSIALGKILGGTILSLVQAMIMLFLAPLVGISLSVGSLLLTFFILFIISFGLTGLGFIIAWKMDSTQGFHAIMNLFLIPLWLLSGALFPPSGSAKWLSTIMLANPLSYGVSALRSALYLNGGVRLPDIASLPVSALVSFCFAGVMLILSTMFVRQSRMA